MLRRGLNSIDELEQAEKDENAAFEQAISEGTFHDWSAIVEQSEWDSLGLGQFIDPPFVVGGDLEWLKHFDRHTKTRSNGRHRLLILDGHESQHSADFETYCEENNIMTLCMPPPSSHLLQPLDIGCFGQLKKAYGQKLSI
ncbi:transposase [Fusarium oxysporum f. sp. phaseoli]